MSSTRCWQVQAGAGHEQSRSSGPAALPGLHPLNTVHAPPPRHQALGHDLLMLKGPARESHTRAGQEKPEVPMEGGASPIMALWCLPTFLLIGLTALAQSVNWYLFEMFISIQTLLISIELPIFIPPHHCNTNVWHLILYSLSLQLSLPYLPIMGWAGSPIKRSQFPPSVPVNVAWFGNRVLCRWSSEDVTVRVGLNPIGPRPCWERKHGHRGRGAHTRGNVRASNGIMPPQPKGQPESRKEAYNRSFPRASRRRVAPQTPWSPLLASRMDMINFCCLNRSLCGPLPQQP